MNMFRALRADEIDCRVAQIKESQNKKGLSLLLYKDARCDQNILDETVTPMGWMRTHTRDNRNCIVSIWDAEKAQWIAKEDTGTESNTEREKGLASDSFKRACFNWGIGRELYTAPFIWITEDKCNIKESRGKLVCYDRFTVKAISYTNGVITGLQIKNQATGKVCYDWGQITKDDEAPEKPEQPDNEPDVDQKESIGQVEKSDKLPVDPTVNFIKNEICDIQEIMKFKSYQEAREQIFTWADELVKAKALDPFRWPDITMETARRVFKAIRVTFVIHKGDAA